MQFGADADIYIVNIICDFISHNNRSYMVTWFKCLIMIKVSKHNAIYAQNPDGSYVILTLYHHLFFYG